MTDPHDHFQSRADVSGFESSQEKRPGAPGVKLYSGAPPASRGQQFGFCYQRKPLAILIAIRRRLTAQGNGQATLDHEGTPLPGMAAR
jgi:hypothetical protein